MADPQEPVVEESPSSCQSEPLSTVDIAQAMLIRIDKLHSITQVISQVELGGHGHVIRSHLALVANNVVNELRILAEEIAEPGQ